MAAEKRARKRQMAYAEIIETERRYVSDMTALCDCFVRPLRTEAMQAAAAGREPLMSPMEHAQIFGAIEQLLMLNTKLLSDMTAGSNVSIGPLFTEFSPYLKMYSLFAGAYTTAATTLAELKVERDGLSDWLDIATSDTRCRGLQITDLLIMPVQRVPRYRMLLAELIKHTDPSDSTHGPLTKALEGIKDTAATINNYIAAAEERMKIIKIQSEVFGDNVWLAKAGRRLIMRDDMTKVCRSRNKIYHFFLFTDAVMYASERTAVTGALVGGTHKFHREIDLKTARLLSAPAKIGDNAFCLQSPKKSFFVIAPDAEMKKKWCTGIEANIRSLAAVGGDGGLSRDKKMAPVWQPDDDANQCHICKAEFTFWKRRHHCRNCGHVVCSDCSNKRFRLDHISVKPSRVCSRCFDYLHEREMRGVGGVGKHGRGPGTGGVVASVGSSHTIVGGSGNGGGYNGRLASAKSTTSMASHLSAPSGLIPVGMGPRREDGDLGGSKAATASTANESGLPSGWCLARTETGETYYFNEVSGETSWDLPQEKSAGSGSRQKKKFVRPITPPDSDEEEDDDNVEQQQFQDDIDAPPTPAPRVPPRPSNVSSGPAQKSGENSIFRKPISKDRSKRAAPALPPKPAKPAKPANFKFTKKSGAPPPKPPRKKPIVGSGGLETKAKQTPSWATLTPRRHMSSSDDSFSDTDSDNEDQDQFVEAVSRPSKKVPPQRRALPAAKPAGTLRHGVTRIAKKFIPETPMGNPEPTPTRQLNKPPRPSRPARETPESAKVETKATALATPKPARPPRPDRPRRQLALSPDSVAAPSTGKPARPARPERPANRPAHRGRPDRPADRPDRPARSDRPADMERPARPDRTLANPYRSYVEKVPYAELSTKHMRPSDVDGANLEKYLSASEFESIFCLSEAQFALLPAWKKKQLKQQKQLF